MQDANNTNLMNNCPHNNIVCPCTKEDLKGYIDGDEEQESDDENENEEGENSELDDIFADSGEKPKNILNRKRKDKFERERETSGG